MTEERKVAVALFGATGTGKTALAAALADRFPCHLISCDALQIYRDLRAATAKPEGAELRHPWALVDRVSPHQEIDLGSWVRGAEAELAWAWRNRRLPLIVGGTGMYLRGLAKGLAPAPPRDPALRARLERLWARHGEGRLHRWLSRLDSRSAARIEVGDRQRLLRALEVRVGSGKSLIALQADGWRGADRWPLLRLGLQSERARLHARLDRRVRQFFQRGLVAECRWLLERAGVSPEANALRGIGYRETVGWLGSGSVDGLESLIATVQASTRQYAKRQSTWFRAEIGTLWLDADQPDLLSRCCQEIEKLCL